MSTYFHMMPEKIVGVFGFNMNIYVCSGCTEEIFDTSGYKIKRNQKLHLYICKKCWNTCVSLGNVGRMIKKGKELWLSMNEIKQISVINFSEVDSNWFLYKLKGKPLIMYH